FRIDPRLGRSNPHAPAAAGARPSHQAALRAPGRTPPAGGRDPRQPDRARARRVPARTPASPPRTPRRIRDADPYRVPHRRESLQGQAQPAHAAPAAEAKAAHETPQETEMSMNGTAEDVLDFWFGTEEGVSPMPRWFQASAEFDEEIRRRFGDAVQA